MPEDNPFSSATSFFLELHQFSSTDDSREASASRSVRVVTRDEGCDRDTSSYDSSAAVCAASRGPRGTLIFLSRGLSEKPSSARCSLSLSLSLLVLGTDGRVDISRSRIRNLIAASRPQFEFHEILSTKPIRSYSAARTTFAPHVRVSKTHTHTHTHTHVCACTRVYRSRKSSRHIDRENRAVHERGGNEKQKPSGPSELPWERRHR